MQAQGFIKIIKKVESDLGGFYGFSPAIQAKDCLAVHTADAETPRGQVLYCAETEETAYLGLELREDIVSQLVEYNPYVKLDLNNIDAFCVVVEEVSHFHLLANRILKNQEVRTVELEWQAEVDKLLFSSLLLHQQTENHHFFPLAKLIYENPSYSVGPKELERYRFASKLAARFWYDQAPSLNSNFLARSTSLLRQMYDWTWPQKVAWIEQPKMKAA